MVVLNREVRLILVTHLAFYRRHPWLIVLFFLGLSLGSALLTAISGLNQEAKSRYQQSSALIDDPVSHLIRPLPGQEYFSGDLWVKLRRHGFTRAFPVLNGKVKLGTGKHMAIKGVDTLQWLALNADYSATSRPQKKQIPNTGLSLNNVLIDKQFKARFSQLSDSDVIFTLPDGVVQPRLSFVENIGYGGLTDIAYADQVLQANGQISFIELSYVDDTQLDVIRNIIANQAVLVAADQQTFDVLSDAFFFNLTALALLGYIVAAFLSFNAIKLTLAARKKLLNQMHLLGCSKAGIQLALMIELGIVSLLTALLGCLGGYLIANALVVDVNRTLMSLYQLDKALIIHWQWQHVVTGLGLNLTALGVILASQLNTMATRSTRVYPIVLATTLSLLVWLLMFATTKFQALLLCFTLLMMFVLVVPKILALLMRLPIVFKHPLALWMYNDTRYHIKDLHIAIIAILVAMGSAIGMQIMVQSFSKTLNNHLEKQLSADIYLKIETPEHALRKRLEDDPQTTLVSLYLQSDGHVNGLPATLGRFGEDASHYQHISLTSGKPVTPQEFTQSGCLANEQSKIKFSLSLGQDVSFQQGQTHITCRISGFFYDYGNPSISLLTLAMRPGLSAFNSDFFGYSIRLSPNTSVAYFSEVLVEKYRQNSEQIMPNQIFKDYANQLFDDTFVVTKALNGFILAIALISLFTSLLSLSENQLKQLVILKNLGVTQTQLLWLKLTQTATLVGFTTAFAVPLGFSLGLALLKFVMPIAFGWTIHFNLDLLTLVTLCVTLILVSVFCAYLPIRKITQHDT